MGDELERSVMVQKNVCWKQSNQPQCRSLHPPHNCHYPFFKLRYVWCESSIKLDKPKTTTSGWYISMIAWRYRPILRLSLVFLCPQLACPIIYNWVIIPHPTGTLQVMLGWSSILWLTPLNVDASIPQCLILNPLIHAAQCQGTGILIVIHNATESDCTERLSAIAHLMQPEDWWHGIWTFWGAEIPNLVSKALKKCTPIYKFGVFNCQKLPISKFNFLFVHQW
jgi:hypothetical protein